MTALVASEGENRIGSSYGPKHTGLFQSRSDDGFAAGLDNTRADEEVLGTELRIPHALRITREIFGLCCQEFRRFDIRRCRGAQGSHQRLNLTGIQLLL